MKIKFILIIFILLTSACQARTIKESQRTVIRPQQSFSRQPLALVIGNLRYEHNPLNNPKNDATDMGKLLKEIGFEVTLKINLNQGAMEDAIRQFAQRLSKNRGIGVFYFAGHGAQVKGRNYLLPIDNRRIQDEIDLEKRAIYVDEILKRMENAKTTLNIIILDACRDNPYRGGRTLRRGLAPILSTTLGSIIAFATAPGKTAADRDKKGRNGLFTSHLLSALKNAYQTHQRLDDMFMDVHNAVAQESRGRQKPWYSASLTEPFCFGDCQTDGTQSTVRLQESSPAPKMVSIPAGRFKMGNHQGGGEGDEQPVHEVSVNRFAISRYEITFAEYDRFAQATDRDKPDDEGWGRGNRPVINISWDEAQAYTEWLSQETGQQYRLPTEAEWEYAARAGTQTKYWWGNEIGRNRANCDGCGSRWDKTTMPVGSFAPNAFGLYDTSGNVEEWTCSQYEDKYRGKEQTCVKRANEIVLRGGSGIDFRLRLRSAFRNSRKPSERFRFVGFRVVRPR